MPVIDKKVNFKMRNLNGPDGNAFVILGNFAAAARRAEWTKEEIDAVINEAKSGDYDNLKAVIKAHCK